MWTDKNYHPIVLPLKKNWLCGDTVQTHLLTANNEFWELVASSYGMTLDRSRKPSSLFIEHLILIFEGHRYEVIDSFTRARQKELAVISIRP